MKTAIRIPPLAWAALAFAGWRSIPLLHAWRHSPLDRWGWLAFLSWFVPVVLARIPRSKTSAWDGKRGELLLPAGILATLVSVLGQFNAAAYLGLALVLAALTPFQHPLRLAAWLGTALAWMPVFSWIAHGLPGRVIVLLRLGLAFGGLVVMILDRRSVTSEARA